MQRHFTVFPKRAGVSYSLVFARCMSLFCTLYACLRYLGRQTDPRAALGWLQVELTQRMSICECIVLGVDYGIWAPVVSILQAAPTIKECGW